MSTDKARLCSAMPLNNKNNNKIINVSASLSLSLSLSLKNNNNNNKTKQQQPVTNYTLSVRLFSLSPSLSHCALPLLSQHFHLTWAYSYFWLRLNSKLTSFTRNMILPTYTRTNPGTQSLFGDNNNKSPLMTFKQKHHIYIYATYGFWNLISLMTKSLKYCSM